MSTLSAVHAANATALSSLPRVPVALFVGGTSGLGQGVAEAFAEHTKGRAHIIICGRNRKAAEEIIESFPKSDKSKFEFMECDATLMKNVGNTTSSLLTSLPKLNYLVLTPGYLSMSGRNETAEGIDRKLALHYYARWKFTNDLLPLLQKAKDAGEDAKVLSVLGAGYHNGPIDLNDLGLKTNYSVTNAATHGITYNDLMIESFSALHPDMTFTHASPGAVRTPILSNIHWTMKPLSPLLNVLAYPFMMSQADSGQYMLRALLAGESGAFRRGSKAQLLEKGKGYFATEETRKAVWEHSVEITKLS